jgi:tetratricopeptide (TPR) repeat protein
VSREELRQHLWHSDTFVDFDNNLNTAINKIREALGDSAEAPHFVETVPRRGYRFIAGVENDELKPPTTGASAVSPTLVRRTAMLASVLVVAGLFAGVLIRHWRQAHSLTEKDAVIIGDFANSTGDGIFDGTLRQGLLVQLQQSPFLKLPSEEQIHRTLRMMGRETNARLTPEITREICQRTNSAVALEGSISLIGTRYDVILRGVDCVSGDLLASAESQAKDKSGVLDAVGEVAAEMRSKLGESLSTIQRHNTPLVQATTRSLEALRSYSLGADTLTRTGDFAASLPFFQRATELDPDFAMAYWAMSDAYSVIGETDSSRESIRKAFELRTGASEMERLLIEGDYYFFALGDLIKTRRTFELCAKLYPRNDYAHNVLGALSNMLGRYEAGLGEYREALRLAPLRRALYRDVVYTYLLLDRVDLAAVAADEAHAKNADDDLAPILYSIAFYRNDTNEMARQVAATAGKLGREDLLLALQGDTAAYFGLLGKARGFSRRAIESAQVAGDTETAAGYYAESALREALLGDSAKARQLATTAKRLSGGRDMDYGVALALAYSGSGVRAQALADDLANRYPEDTIVQFNYLPTLRARLAISHSNPRQALDILTIAIPYELGLPAYSDYNWPNLYPVYVRGEAYLAAHRGSEAAAEFQKILDHRGIVLNEPIGALAHLQLGRAYTLAGDNAQAKPAYENFLALWKDADPDIPILRQAKAEYAKLP